MRDVGSMCLEVALKGKSADTWKYMGGQTLELITFDKP